MVRQTISRSFRDAKQICLRLSEVRQSPASVWATCEQRICYEQQALCLANGCNLLRLRTRKIHFMISIFKQLTINIDSFNSNRRCNLARPVNSIASVNQLEWKKSEKSAPQMADNEQMELLEQLISLFILFNNVSGCWFFHSMNPKFPNLNCATPDIECGNRISRVR